MNSLFFFSKVLWPYHQWHIVRNGLRYKLSWEKEYRVWSYADALKKIKQFREGSDLGMPK